MRFSAIHIILLVLLTACTGGEPATPTITPRPLIPGDADALAAGAPTPSGVRGTQIVWNRDPSQIVFQADVPPSEPDVILARNHVPDCTVYGDNLVVWTNELSSLHVQVLYDQISDSELRFFIESLIVSEQFYNYGKEDEPQATREANTATERLALDINNEPHVTDGFDGWPDGYYRRLRDRCRSLSQTPVLYAPQNGAWVTARQVEPDSSVPVVLWDKNATGVDFADIAASGGRQWVDLPIMGTLWLTLREAAPVLHFVQDEGDFRVALEVPNVSAAAPGYPAEGEFVLEETREAGVEATLETVPAEVTPEITPRVEADS